MAVDKPSTVSSAAPAIDEDQAVIGERETSVTRQEAAADLSQKPIEPKPEGSRIPPTTGEAKPGNTVEISTATTSLSMLLSELPEIVTTADHSEMWGVTLKDADHVPTTIILEKFLRANDKDVMKAKAQLIEALVWRKSMQPLELLAKREFDSESFGELGYVTVYEKTENYGREVVTWNIYGAVKNKQKTFGDVEEFIRWRSALMELSLQELDLNSASERISENGTDPYKMVQVHDYLNVSFLRMDPTIRTASKRVIETFSMAYPELLKEKFFVNVPLVMAWVFTTIKLFLSPQTVKKFHPLSYGKSLAGELCDIGEELPEEYGGKGKPVRDGLHVKYAGTATATTTT